MLVGFIVADLGIQYVFAAFAVVAILRWHHHHAIRDRNQGQSPRGTLALTPTRPARPLAVRRDSERPPTDCLGAVSMSIGRVRGPGSGSGSVVSPRGHRLCTLSISARVAAERAAASQISLSCHK